MATEIKSSDILTPEQLTNHSKIFAGPGAGKTHFLVENVKSIVTTNLLVAQSRSRKVLCITYTNAAVSEIVRRLDRYADSVEVYTIHSFIIEHIIKPFQQELRAVISDEFGINVKGKSKITSQVEGLGILHGIDKTEIFNFIKKLTKETEITDYSKKIMGDVQININEYDVHPIIFMNKQPVERLIASSKISTLHLLLIKEFVWSVAKKLTHDEILYFGHKIIERNHTALYATRVRFPFIFVDEFQDTNPLQTRIIKKIAEKSTIVCVIGDVAQSIYSFQGAKPSQFDKLKFDGQRTMAEYFINGNRRSTDNIVNFCNFLRQSDATFSQVSDKAYSNNDTKQEKEAIKVRFIVGNSSETMTMITTIINDGGVVLTRTWAAAFSYIQGISSEQAKCLSDIHGSYSQSPIDLRRDIEEHSYVTWVKSFKFIFGLWSGYRNGAFVDVFNTLLRYTQLDPKLVTPKFISALRKLSERLFVDLTEQSVYKQTVDIINNFNTLIKAYEFKIHLSILGSDFAITVFDEQDRDVLKENVSKLNWQTSYKLFTEVFSPNSRYMTVHQAKGLEWKKVIVSVNPNKRKDINNTTLSAMYANPKIKAEEAAEEFTRLYYVACSRAKEELYIHLPDNKDMAIIKTAIDTFIENSVQKIEYEFIF